MVILHIKLKGIRNAATVANILPADPSSFHTLTLGMGSIGQINYFQNKVMLHIKLKGITQCSNMVANFFPTTDPLPPHDPRGWGQ